MKKLNIFMLALLLVGMPFLMAAGHEANAAAADQAGQAGLQDRGAAALGEVRLEAIQPKAQMQAADEQFDQERAAKKAERAARKEARNQKNAQNEAKAFEFNQMLGNEQFNADVHGVPAADRRMTVQGGKAALDMNDNFEMGVKGLKDQNGQPVAGERFKAAVACMDSGMFMAKDENMAMDENPDNSGEGSFEVDENGDGDFQGKMDFAGASCVAPTPMVMDQDNRFVAIGGHAMANDADDDDDDKNNERANKEDDDDEAMKEDDEDAEDNADKFLAAVDEEDEEAEDDEEEDEDDEDDDEDEDEDDDDEDDEDDD